MNRRSFLRSAPLAAAIPVGAAAQTETPIMALYHQWKVRNDFLNSEAVEKLTWDQIDAGNDVLSELEDRLMALPPETTADVLAQLAVLSSLGDYAIPAEHPVLWHEVERLLAA